MNLIIIIHWTTCYTYAISERDHSNFDDLEFNFNFWMPPVDLNDGDTEYYHEVISQKYNVSFYYAILLITGNDICP